MKNLFAHGKGYARALALKKKTEGGKGRRLNSSESKYKTKNWPKSKGPMTAAEIMKMRGE